MYDTTKRFYPEIGPCMRDVQRHLDAPFRRNGGIRKSARRGIRTNWQNGGNLTSDSQDVRHPLLRSFKCTCGEKPTTNGRCNEDGASVLISDSSPINGVNTHSYWSAFQSFASSKLRGIMTIDRLKQLTALLEFVFVMLQIVGYLLGMILLAVVAFKVYENHILLTEILESLKLK